VPLSRTGSSISTYMKHCTCDGYELMDFCKIAATVLLVRGTESHPWPERAEMEPRAVRNVGPSPYSEININVGIYLINTFKNRIFSHLLNKI
jgi:hypothetical protein